MLLTAEKTRRLIGGLTIAAFFLGLILGYNNIWNFLFECTRGSKERQKKHVNLFCNLESRFWTSKESREIVKVRLNIIFLVFFIMDAKIVNGVYYLINQ